MNLSPWKSAGSQPIFRGRQDDGLTSFEREMNSLMKSFLGRSDWAQPFGLISGDFPAMDLSEKDNKYLVDLDVPGMNEADIDINFQDHTLTIKGESKNVEETKDYDYVCVERTRGAFRRDIYLDQEIDKDSIKADLKNGVLHVELIKKEKSNTVRKKIPIHH